VGLGADRHRVLTNSIEMVNARTDGQHTEVYAASDLGATGVRRSHHGGWRCPAK